MSEETTGGALPSWGGSECTKEASSTVISLSLEPENQKAAEVRNQGLSVLTQIPNFIVEPHCKSAIQEKAQC